MLKRLDSTGRFIGDRPFYREVILIALPVILQQLIATTMGFIDSVMVGQIDAQAMASILVSNKYFLIMQAILFGLTGGIGIFISQYFGADDHEKGQGLFVINILGSISVAAVFLALITAAPRAMMSLFVENQATVDYGMAYLNNVRFSYLPFAISLASMTSLRAIGENRKPLVISSSAILLSTGLNYLLIFGNFGFPKMGVAGAGLATLIARLYEMTLYLILLGRNKQYFNLKIAPIRRLTKDILLLVLRKAIPMTGNELLWSVGMVMIFKTYCLVNEANIASLTIVEMTNNFVFILFGAFAAAISILIGARLGASRFAEARKNATRLLALGAIIGVLSGIIVFLISDRITLLFNVSDELRLLATNMLRIQSVFYPLITVNVIFFFILRVGGDMFGTVMVDAGYIWLIALPLAAGLSLLVKPEMVVFYLAIQSTEIVKFAIAWRLYRRGKWLCNLT